MKSAEEIYQELALEFQRRTGLTAGGSGDLAVRFYAVAAQLSGLYAQAEWTGRQCFPQTARGEALDLHAGLRGIARQQAEKAVGKVRFFAGEGRSEGAEIPVGTVCMTGTGLRYYTVEAGMIPAEGTMVELTVEAEQAGEGWNTPAETIVYLALPPQGITACTNPAALSSGQEAEGDEELRKRIMETYHRLANGANAALYRQTALDFPGVAAAAVLPRNRGVGTVDVVVAAQGGMPDDTLLEQLQARLEQVREIAVDVQVLPPAQQVVDVAIALEAESGMSFTQVSDAVREAVTNWFTGEQLGRAVLRAELTALVFAVEGAANCAVTLPESDVLCDSMTLPVLGQLTITQM